MAQSLHRKLYVRLAQHWIDDSCIQAQRVVRLVTGHRPKSTHIADVQLLRLPGLESLCDLLWKSLWVGGCAERFFRQYRRGLMMTVPVAVRARKARHQHFRTKGSNHSH